jgi:7,8-dihydroneopterin aldolase/epimerase/oxygenase
MDCIHVNVIRSYGYTGFLAEEQILGQWFEVNLKLWLDLSQAGQSDRIEDTLDYRQVISMTKTLIQTQKFALIERLASAIADQILEHTAVQQVQVCLTKLAPPIPEFSGSITIELTRSRH